MRDIVRCHLIEESSLTQEYRYESSHMALEISVVINAAVLSVFLHRR